MNKEPEFHVGCMCKIKVDECENILRVEEFVNSDKSKVKLRFTHPNRDIYLTLPIKALIYMGASYVDYQKNYITTKR